MRDPGNKVETNQKKRLGYVIDYIVYMNAKQKIVHGRRLSSINLGSFVCSFEVCRAS